MMHQLAQNLVYGNWWVAFGAYLLVNMTLQECGATGLHPQISVFVLGATVTVYGLNMLSGLGELRRSDTRSVRHHWCITNENWLKVHVTIGATVAIGTILMLPETVLLVLIPTSAVTLLYVLPVMKGVRLREVGSMKIIWVATVWSSITVILPALASECGSFAESMASMTAERWLFIFSITVPFDIRDMDNDRSKGVRTLPLIGGVRRSKVIALCALVCSLLLVFHRYNWEPSPQTLAYAFTMFITSILIAKSGKGRDEMYYSFLVDGTMVLLALSVILSSTL
jgi:4-hydroxybenzoate polyprenyltransferase